MSEFIHVSELYETILMIMALIMLVLEILSIVFDTFKLIAQQKIKKHNEIKKWQLEQKYQKESLLERQKTQVQRNLSEEVNKVLQNLEKENNQQQQSLQIQNKQQKEQKEQKVQKQQQEQQKKKNNKQINQTFILIYKNIHKLFDQNISILISLLISGILTASTQIFSLAIFFCFLFVTILIDLIHIEDQIHAKELNSNSSHHIVKKLMKLLSGTLIIIQFISYWVIDQF